MARSFTFEATPAVRAARERSAFVNCPVCDSNVSGYLFHKRGVRFVRCFACGLVYVNPTGGEGTNYFDVAAMHTHEDARDRAAYVDDMVGVITRMVEQFTRERGRKPRAVTVVGRYLKELDASQDLKAMGARFVQTSNVEFQALRLQGDVTALVASFKGDEDIVILNEFLEATAYVRRVVEELAAKTSQETWIGVIFANAQSLPARTLRRYWPRYYDMKSAFLSAPNLAQLFATAAYTMVAQRPVPSNVSAAYFMERVGIGSKLASTVSPLRDLQARIPAGVQEALFRRDTNAQAAEKLSIILPIFNEARYAADVIEAVLEKEVRIPKEVIIVESNSTDGTREIVKTFEGRPGVTILYEDKPSGKGHAVRTGLKHVTGSIILIQDSDFEYDLDDYDALLEPILQRKTSFVLGSRSLGLDDWKVRKYSSTPVRGFLMNFAQVGFAKTFNALYQQDVTDVNTMFKVFRSECLNGVELVCDGFNLDIELACKIVKNGYEPMEVPVNYVSRGFDEGKKINFWKDAWPSYAAFFRYRFGS
jgi:ribosomal protein S27E